MSRDFLEQSDGTGMDNRQLTTCTLRRYLDETVYRSYNCMGTA